MPTPPSVAPLAGALADIATDLRRGSCCLVVCDKGWTLPIYTDLRDRLRAANMRCGYLDGRPTETAHADLHAMTVAVAKIRWAARAEEMAGVVFAIPYLDIMASIDGGWNTISRDVVPLLYENPTTIWLGFQDPTLPLLPIVEKVFGKRHVIDVPYRASEPAPPPAAPEPPPVESAKEPEAPPPEEPK